MKFDLMNNNKGDGPCLFGRLLPFKTPPPPPRPHLALRSLVFKPWCRGHCAELVSTLSALRGSMLFSLKTNTVLLQENKNLFL